MRTQNNETQSKSNNCSNRVRTLQSPEMTGLVNMFVHALVFVVVVQDLSQVVVRSVIYTGANFCCSYAFFWSSVRKQHAF